MSIDLKINNDFHGPTILDLEPVFTDIAADVVDVLWKNSKAEIAALESHPEKSFVLYVPDLVAMERAAEALGLSVKYDINTLETGKLALLKKERGWDDFVKGVGSTVARGILVKLVSRAVGRGMRVNDSSAVADDVIFGGVNLADADIFLRIHKLRGL